MSDTPSNPASLPPAGDKVPSLRALGAPNFFLADVQTGVGPFLVVSLATQPHRMPRRIGLAMDYLPNFAVITAGESFIALAGAIFGPAVGVGTFLSNLVGGFVAKHAGVNAAFLMLAAIAAVGLGFFWRMVPETLGMKSPAGAAA